MGSFNIDQWADSKDGKLKIRLYNLQDEYHVYALYAGTHELAPRSRSFKKLQDAKDYANALWRGRS